ncbi:MAG: tRNA (guanosine(37)-N1)-methyltransferase TrmD [Planctomycetota bacterium]
MLIDVVTIFPEMFERFVGTSIVGRAQEKGLVKITLHDLRDFTTDKHNKVDDKPFGGGPGMVLMVEPVARAMAFLKKPGGKGRARTPAVCPTAEVQLHRQPNYKAKAHNILLSPRGRRFNQEVAQELASKGRLVMLCGHYEGFDQRVNEIADFDEISVGDFVTSGGETPAMVLIDAVVRLIPGVLGNARSLKEESFADGKMLEYPQYTRPRIYKGLKVPEVLISGNHKEIAKWRALHRKERKGRKE